ncbi:hypothetical protein GH714_016934 [Hevea brasiliensis]|uniref:R13L1/DRL21-like LRR repeat region domain-containing protein n=1 Tax=Hevea brasiliensis TaxID=3981 RepID=A0A6A6N8A9_HEVBR|nr:hypothetical protein GH714_016934 [Hevea brasiliensis]
MPPQMGNLVKLRTLTNFSLGKWYGSGIKELGKLQHINGELSIENLQNINPKHVWESKLRNKEQLKTLEFKWRGKSKDAKHAKKTLEQLWPHEKVENLYIVGYDGTRFPYWNGSKGIGLSEFTIRGNRTADGLTFTLEEIELFRCAIERFPLEIFPNLKRIEIFDCSNLKSLTATEEIQVESSSCPNLTELLLERCSNLKSLPEYIGFHPSIVKLQISDCGELELFPKGGLPSKLESLAIDGCGKLKIKVIEGIDNNYEGDEETLPLLPSTLTYLRIDGLRNLESLKYKRLVHLRELIILRCPNLRSIPDCMQDLPLLVKLEISGCPN